MFAVSLSLRSDALRPSSRFAAIQYGEFHLFLAAAFSICLFPVLVSAHHGLLCDHKLNKGFTMGVLFQFLEGGFLRLRHRAADAMAFALEFADADAGAGN